MFCVCMCMCMYEEKKRGRGWDVGKKVFVVLYSLLLFLI